MYRTNSWVFIGFIAIVGCAGPDAEHENAAVAESYLVTESGLVRDLAKRAADSKAELDVGVKYANSLVALASSTCAVRVGGRGANDSNTGASWSQPMATVQAAIERAQAAAVAQGLTICNVWIRTGTYRPPSAGAFTLRAKVGLYGGFRGTETDPSQRSQGYRSTLSGSITVDPNAGVVVDSISLPASLSRSTGTSLVNNCVFNGTGTAISAGSGGTLTVSNSQFSNTGTGINGNCTGVSVTNSTFYSSDTAVTIGCGRGFSITGSTFLGVAGALRISMGYGSVTNSQFRLITGTAVQGYDASVTIADSVFEDNDGTLISVGDGSATVRNCKFWNNASTCLYAASSPTSISVSQSSFNSNYAATASVAQAAGPYTSVNFSTSIIWGNGSSPFATGTGGTLSFSNSDVEGGPAGTGVLNLDPMFVDPANADLHVSPSSPIYSLGWGYIYP